MVARIVLWNVFDSNTTLEELRHHLPELPEGDSWLANGAADRFGLVSFADELPDIAWIRALIGREPDVFEEFDVLD